MGRATRLDIAELRRPSSEIWRGRGFLSLSERSRAIPCGLCRYDEVHWAFPGSAGSSSHAAQRIAFAPAIIGLHHLAIAGLGLAARSRPYLRRVPGYTDTGARSDRLGRDAGSVCSPCPAQWITQLSNALRSLLRRLDLTQQEKTEAEEKSAAEAHRLNQNIDALRELADTDPLSGLPNRRGIATMGEEVLATFSRTGSPFSVLIVDIDHFKRKQRYVRNPAETDVSPAARGRKSEIAERHARAGLVAGVRRF